MNKINKQFTMVEIIISLGIMTIAMFTLVGLMPAGIQSSQDTEHNVQAPLVAEQFAYFVELMMIGDGSTGTANSTGNGIFVDDGADGADVEDDADTDESRWETWEFATANTVRLHDGNILDNGVDDATLSQGGITDIGGLITSGHLPGVNDDVVDDPFVSDLKLYVTDTIAGEAGGRIVGGRYETTIKGAIDQQYAIRVYYTDFDIVTTSGVGSTSSGSGGVLFAVEVTWPINMPYEKRLALGNQFIINHAVQEP